jgi:CheY-like chemotaxis protein
MFMRKRILLAEDEPVSRKSVSAFLRDDGFEVDEAKDGAEALTHLDTSSFDLVLSDVHMPQVNGILVILHLRSLSPATPFMFITAYPYHPDLLSIFPKAQVMGKPVLLDDLQTRIHAVLDGGL